MSPLRIRVYETVLPNGFLSRLRAARMWRSRNSAQLETVRFVKRFALMQSYAHALFDGDMVVKATRPGEAMDLRTTRAVGFAWDSFFRRKVSERMCRVLGRASRAGSSNRCSTGHTNRFEPKRRSPPGSQLITYLDVAEISARFGADYVATVMRLLSLGMISDSESRDLLSAKRQQAAAQWSTLVGDVDLGCDDELLERSFRLKAEILHLAVEAYRRQLDNEGSLRRYRGAPAASRTSDHQATRARTGRSLAPPVLVGADAPAER